MEQELLYAWCAGIVDGEGHIALIKRRYQENPVVEVGNTDDRIIYKLKDCFGGSISLNNKAFKNRAICWKWYVRGSNVIELLEKIIPYLVSKKEKAEIVLEYAYTIGKKPIDRNYRNELVEILKGR